MFQHLMKLFRHDGMAAVQPLNGGQGAGKVRSSAGAGRTAQADTSGGRAPLAVGDSRFLVTNGMFQGARQWL